MIFVLEGRKIQGRPYGGTWQARRTGSLRAIWQTWREERGVREFDRYRLTVWRVSTLPGSGTRLEERVWPRG